MQEALRPETAEKGPVRILPVPEDRIEARSNLMAFCDEQRAKQKLHDMGEDEIQVTSMPRLRRCYGWMRVTSAQLHAKIPRRRWPEYIDAGEWARGPENNRDYLAMVYEYIEDGENIPEKMQETIDFLHDTGFHYTICTMLRNWKNSMLIDFSDIIHVGGNGWCDVRDLKAIHMKTE